MSINPNEIKVGDKLINEHGDKSVYTVVEVCDEAHVGRRIKVSWPGIVGNPVTLTDGDYRRMIPYVEPEPEPEVKVGDAWSYKYNSGRKVTITAVHGDRVAFIDGDVLDVASISYLRRNYDPPKQLWEGITEERWARITKEGRLALFSREASESESRNDSKLWDSQSFGKVTVTPIAGTWGKL